MVLMGLAAACDDGGGGSLDIQMSDAAVSTDASLPNDANIDDAGRPPPDAQAPDLGQLDASPLVEDAGFSELDFAVDAALADADIDDGGVAQPDAEIPLPDAMLACIPEIELCNGVDDDCDGEPDNGAECPNGGLCVMGECLDEPRLSPPGGACVEDEDCGDGGECIAEDGEDGPSGFPGGYCLFWGCAEAADCPDGSDCFVLGDAEEAACLPTCDDADDCRAEYGCTPDGICLPQDSLCEAQPEQCNGIDDDCDGVVDNGQLCAPGGVCIDGACDACGPLDFEGECIGSTSRWCDAGVVLEFDCAANGEICAFSDDVGATCFPAPILAGNPGDACSTDVDCGADGACIPELSEGAPTGYPGGYCLWLFCEDDVDCPENSACYFIEDELTACLPGCDQDADCRVGYECDPDQICSPSLDGGACAPEVCNGLDDDCDGVIDNGVCLANGCASDLDCASGACDLNYPGGWCVEECRRDEDCPGRQTCTDFGGGFSYCLEACEESPDCRQGWACYGDENVCWVHCSNLDCGDELVCTRAGTCELPRYEVRLDGVQVFPVDRLSNNTPWDGIGAGVFDPLIDAAAELGRWYLEAKLCTQAEGAPPAVGNVVNDICEDLVDRVVTAAADFVQRVVMSVLEGVEPPDPQGRAIMRIDDAERAVVLPMVRNTYHPTWDDAAWPNIALTPDVTLRVVLTDDDLVFDDQIGSVTLTHEDLLTAVGDVRVPIITDEQGGRNIVFVEVTLTPMR